MSALLEIARKVTPPGARRFLRSQHRRLRFGRAMRIAAVAPAGAALSPPVIRDLVYGWGNEEWSARAEFILAFLAEAWMAGGPILECGSGLSTLLLGLVAQRTGNRLVSLEHNPFWAGRIRAALAEHRIDRVEVCEAPLRSYGGFTWYRPPEECLPEGGFSLVVCDGPPGDTPGGRYGLLPVMRRRLRPGCVVLLDDAYRPEEQAILDRWAGELGTSFTIEGSVKPYGRVVVPG